jgi:RNA polymerase primary sigma factor
MRGTASTTDGATDLMRQYLREIGAYPLLSGPDEVALATAMEAGCEAQAELVAAGDGMDASRRSELKRISADGRDARERFIQSNLRLVVSIAKRYQPAGLPLLDLVQEGNLGLMRAVDKFDHRRGFKFSTYATWWIRQAVSRAIADKGRTIRVPVHMVETVSQVAKSASLLSRRNGREPTVEEISEETGLSPERVKEAQRVARDPVSIFEPVGDSDEAELGDFLEDPAAQAPFDAAVMAMEHQQLLTVVASLSEREQRVLNLRFGLTGGKPYTLEEVAREFQVTRERIRQIEAKALAKLRHPVTPPAGAESADY